MLSTMAAVPALIATLRSTPALAQTDPLPSWNDGTTKKSITDFVARVTTQGTPDFVPAEQRVATFDNDGTLWIEQPMYIQLAFILDRVKTLAPQNPSWKTKQPFKAVLDGDMRALAASGERGLVQLMAVTHAGMTSDEFAKIVSDWLASTRDHRFKRPYTELVYQPMLEVLAYLRANSFKTFIVSGGGIEFMRPWSERIYGIPPEQVVGSSIKTRFQMRDGRPVLFRLPEINFIDDKAGKPSASINTSGGSRSRRSATPTATRDAAMDDDARQRRAPRPDRSSYRCRTRIRLRPQVALRQARQGAGRGSREQMGGRRYEEGLEESFRGRVMTYRDGAMSPGARCRASARHGQEGVGSCRHGKEDAYREYCEYLSNAWRRGR